MQRVADEADGNSPDPIARKSLKPVIQSVLYAQPKDRPGGAPPVAANCIADLHLDQIIDAITAGREEYDLEPVFRTPLADVDAIRFRHEVFQDLENDGLFGAIRSFVTDMGAVRASLAQANQIHHRNQKHGWFLDAVGLYGDAISRLVDRFRAGSPRSRGLLAFAEYLTGYAESAEFDRLVAETRKLKAELATVRYCLEIKSDRIRVRKYESEEEFSSAILATFEKFRHGAAGGHPARRPRPTQMNHIEAAILDLVARLYPEVFSALDGFCARNADFLDAAVDVFDHEIQFYVAYGEHMEKFKAASLRFCYPEVSATDKAVSGHQCFDLALADKLVAESTAVVCNDFLLSGDERIFVVSGPNQGGKTTFARTFGQMHFLASTGCPVPGEKAQVFLFDRLFTHFENEEDIASLRGRLEDDLVRIHQILSEATPRSIVILNEIFSSTTLSDALLLGKKIMARIAELDLLCVFVTFVDELAAFSERTVSLVSTVDDQNPEVRTYKIRRRAADGLAYAMTIAEKYGLTYRRLKERIAP